MQKDPRVALGLRVRELRRERGYSQEVLAIRSDIDRTYITSLENGHRNVSIVLIAKICSGLEVSLREFFNDVIFTSLD